MKFRHKSINDQEKSRHDEPTGLTLEREGASRKSHRGSRREEVRIRRLAIPIAPARSPCRINGGVSGVANARSDALDVGITY